MTAVQQPLTPTSPTSLTSSIHTNSRPRNGSTSNAHPLIVRALYDYHSTDATNLSFQAGTLIRVLTQLQSGWWDGCIDGERGWFPCNFVTEVDSTHLDAGEEAAYLDTNDSSSISGDESGGEQAVLVDTEHADDIAQIMSDEFTWVPQADKEGRTFYLNTADGSTSWELPGTRVFLDDWEETQITDDEDEDDEDEAHRSSMDSENSEDILMLGPMTQQEFNIPDFNHLSIHSESSHVSSHGKSNSGGSANLLSVTTSYPVPPPPPTYDSLLPPLRTAVDQLITASTTLSRPQFIPLTDAIVSTIARISASIPREHKDPHIQRFLHFNRYRPMIAAVCSLITSSKLASGDWSPSPSIRKMERDATEVLHKAESFLEYASSAAEIHPRRIRPFFMTTAEGDGTMGGGWSSNIGDGSGGQDHLELLWGEMEIEKDSVEKCVKAMGLPGHSSGGRGRKNSLVIVDDHLTIPFILIAVQETLGAVARFTSMMEAADLSSLMEFGDGGHRSPTIADFASAKQELYNAIGDLVIASQDIAADDKDTAKVDVTTPPKGRKRKGTEGVRNVIKAGESLKTKVHSVCLNVSFMVEEDKIRRRKSSGNDTTPHSFLSTGTAGSFGSQSPRQRSQGRDPSSKVKKIFGDDAPSPPLIQKAPSINPTQDTAWFLKHDLEDDLAYDVKGQVKGGTLDALIERLTRHDMMDSTFNQTFLLTFKSFTTHEEFFDKLIGRFNIVPPPGLTETETEVWKEKVQFPIRFRVLNTIKSWMNNFYTGSPDDPILLTIKRWAEGPLRSAFPVANSQTLVTSVDAQLKPANAVPKVLTMTKQSNVPPPMLPKKLPRDGKGLKFLDVHPMEVTRQITIQQMNLYMKIKVVDCLDKAWSGDKASAENNIKKMIHHANKLTGWAAESILMAGDIKRRVTMLKHWVQVADRCLAVNNFSGLMSIISALNSTPIHRLKRTWEMVPSKTMQTFDELNKVMHSTMNFSIYREKIHTVSLPCLPFLGVYLSDLTFIEDGNPNMLRNNEKLINFSKRMKTSEVMRDLQQYQTVPYPFQRINELQLWLDHELSNSSEIQELYDLSTQVEPREREDEKMYVPTRVYVCLSDGTDGRARLLQESGFL